MENWEIQKQELMGGMDPRSLCFLKGFRHQQNKEWIQEGVYSNSCRREMILFSTLDIKKYVEDGLCL